MVFLCLPSKKQLIYLLLLYLIFAIYHFSVVSFLINSKLQRFSQFLKVMTLLCSQTIGLFLFSPVFLRSSRNFFTSGYQDFSQSLISLIIISMALDHITLLLRLSQNLSTIYMKVLKTISTLSESSQILRKRLIQSTLKYFWIK